MKSETSDQTRKLTILLEVSKALANQLRLDDLLNTIIGKTAEVLDAERATLFLYDQACDELWSKTADHLEIKEIRFPAGAGIAGDVAKAGPLQTSPMLTPTRVLTRISINKRVTGPARFCACP